MKIMDCPLNGPRNISEFICGGEVRATPDPARSSDVVWTDYLFMENNTAGVVYEWWCHVPTTFWFIARRDTRTEDILETMTVAEFDRAAADDGMSGESGT